MENKDISSLFKFAAKLNELHDENPFKIRSYQNAAYQIERLEKQLAEMDIEQLQTINGIGKNIAAKIVDLNTKGTFNELERLLDDTPKSIIEMMNVKGFGPKKIRVVWKELGIEDLDELIKACEKGALAEVKGFGKKTEASIKDSAEYYLENKNQYLYAELEDAALMILERLQNLDIVQNASLTGEIRRKCEVLNSIEILVQSADEMKLIQRLKGLEIFDSIEIKGNQIYATLHNRVNVVITISKQNFYNDLFISTGSEVHVSNFGKTSIDPKSEQEIYESNGFDFVEPELREGMKELEYAKQKNLPKLIDKEEIKGILHAHSTYSDGRQSLEKMALACKELGYEYLGITDHSQTAVYANGLKSERVFQQHEEIASLNKELTPFKIFKGIESDILNDGSLDYEEDVLKSFDFIIASVHSNLKMDEQKATDRILKAIRNPYTTILGHLTSRLLLQRKGYPVDHKKVIDECAEYQVIIEMNANPRRLDMDWRWIGYAIEKGVKISINPDAHNVEGLNHVKLGINAARKGGLTKEMTLNTLSLKEIEKYFEERKPQIVG
ncbi:MAG: DNA polymerase/3'-5' exonuclease PolX [Bacteroidetes bacterium]|nr:MAG: DNA polymerase/3'-5' exonuclease PolX [Bacteroidota bacterium]